MFDVPLDRFEDLVADALGEIPSDLAHRLEDLVVVVSDAPSGAFSGLHDGLPIGGRREQGTGWTVPDRITLHRRTIVDGCRTDTEVVQRIRTALRSEITRLLELPDTEVRALGW